MVEVLEPRWVLSLTNVSIDESQKDVLLNGLDGLAAWGDLLHSHDLADQMLPVIGRSAGQALNLGDILQQGLAEPVADYFAADSSPTTAELVSAIQAINGTAFDNVNLAVTNVSGGLNTASGANELLFHLEFQATRSLLAAPSLGPEGDALGIQFGSQIAAVAELTFDFSFGIDLSSGLSVEEAFFIRSTGLGIEIQSNVPSMPAGPMRIGFFEATPAAGNLALDADLSVTLHNPDQDPAGNITLEELQQTAMSSLVSLVGVGSSSGSVTATLGSLGSFSPSGTPTMSFASGNPFVAPVLDFNTDFDQVRSFTNISAHSYLGVLEQLAVFLDGLSASTALDESVQLATPARIGDHLEMGAVLRQGLMMHLVDDGVATFATAQDLESELAAVLGLPIGTIAADYDPIAKELTYHLVVERAFSPTAVPVGIDLDLAPLSEFTTTSQATLTAEGALEFTLGIDLHDASAVMVATTTAPANGQISADANFILNLGLGTSVAVILTQAATSGNTSRADLVDGMNAALAAAGISGSVVAALDSNNRLTLATVPASGLTALELRAADYNPQGPPSSDPIVTELGFRQRHFAFDSLANHAFVEGATFSGAVALSAGAIDGAAKVGFLDVEVVGGSGTSQADFALQVKNPNTQVAGGRAGLFELQSTLSTGVTEVVDVPTLGGWLAISLPLDAAPLGNALTTSPELVISWPDISSGTANVTLLDGDELLRFEHLSSSDFVDALANVGDYLENLEDFSFFGLEIPGMKKSFSDLAQFSSRFEQFIIAFENDPAAALSDLEQSIQDAFGLPDEALELSLVDDGTVIRADLVIAEEFTEQIPIAVEFPFTDIFGEPIEWLFVGLGGSALLNVDLELDFQLSFGIDISNALSLVPFIYESSYLTAKAEVNAQNVEFDATILFWGVHVRNGKLLIDADGDDTTRDHAILDIQLTDNNPGTSEGKISLASIGLDNADASLTGQLNLVLPMYYPDPGTFVGNLEISIADLGDIEGTTTMVIPDLEPEDPPAGEEPGLLDRLTAILYGLDAWFEITIDALNGRFGSVELPFVGRWFHRVGDFVEMVHEDVVSQITARFHETDGDTGAAVQMALWMALGPSGLNVLQDRDGSGDITIDDIEVVPTDLNQDGKPDQIEFFVDMGQNLTLLDAEIDFDIGLPGLGLDVEGSIELLVGWQWNLAFGLSNLDGFYILTGEEDEIAIDFEMRIPDLRARGQLGFLQFDITDAESGRPPSSFTGGLTIDFLDPTSVPSTPPEERRLTDLQIKQLFLGQIPFDDAFQIDLVGQAEVNLDLLVSFLGDVRFPSIGAEFVVDWHFAGANGGHGLQGGVPYVAFENITLNAGQFISDFSDEVLKTVQKFTQPIQPVVEFVTSPIPLLKDFGFDFTPLEVAAALGYATEAEYIEALAGLISAINNVPQVGDLAIPLGSFVIVAGGQPVDLRDPHALSGADPQVTETVDPVSELNAADAVAGGFFSDLKALGLQFPLIENPVSVFRLMLGQPVDLFLYDVPPLAVNFPFPIVKIGPLIPPVPIFASISGSIGAEIDIAVGFDTRGFQKAQETGDWYDVFAGFFISDRENPDGTGKDVPEATLYGNLNAALELSLVVVGAGVSGGIDLRLFADLVDPNNDGKVHLDELIANIPLGFTGTFDLSGSVTGRLDAFVELLFLRHELNIVEFEIASFEFTTEQIFPDRFSSNNTMSSARFLGAGPGLHVDGLSIASSGDVDWYEFELLRPDSIDVDIRHSKVHGAINLEVYDAMGQKIADGLSGQDRVVASLIDVPAGSYFVRVSGSGRLNNYELAVEPGRNSSTRVFYVAPAGAHDRSASYYTYGPGNDEYAGLNHRKPKASLQGVLDTYQLGPNDIVVFETGVHAPGGVLTDADSGTLFIGSVGGSYLSGVTLDGTSDNHFYRLNLLSNSPGLTLLDSHNNVFELVAFSGSDVNVLLDDSHGNLFDRNTFAGSGDGMRILGDGVNDAAGNIVTESEFQNESIALAIHSLAPNQFDTNMFTGSGDLGVWLTADVPATLVGNTISGRETGILWESRIATVLDNDIVGNTVGIVALGSVVGPDNPTPFGAPGGAAPNRVALNTTGILIPEHAAGTLVRHTEIFDNIVGIDAYGDQTELLANDIHNNVIGIRSDREVGPANWDADLHNFIHDNQVGVVALPGAEVRFNRIFENGIGVQILGTADVHHNLIYRNSGDGVVVDGAHGVNLHNNTIFVPGQSGIRLAGFIEDVDIRNNIVMTTAGYALVVEAASQFGYTSNYNNYFATLGSGVAFQGKGFYDLYDWQVEAESDLRSLGTTVPDPTRDDPLFVDLAGDDYRLLPGSTSIDAGDPTFAFHLEPADNGNRINLGAYGNTPQATPSPAWRLEVTEPNFYVDLIPSQTYAIRWETNNIGPGVDLLIELFQEGAGKIADVATVSAAAGMTTWTPGSFVAGHDTHRYRLRLTTLSGPTIVAESREPFSIPDFDPAVANSFYVNDADTAGDVFTTSVGNNRNTGLTPATPKSVIRPLVLSYPMGPADTVFVDTGDYIHAVNLNLGGVPLAFDSRMNVVSGTTITGPADPNSVARIDRANPHPGSVAIDLIGATEMTLDHLTVVGAGIGARARDGSHDLAANQLVLSGHGTDGLSIEAGSHDAVLDWLTVFDNGRHGIFVDSRLSSLSNSTVYDNSQIGVALRSVGAALVTRNEVYQNFRGIDVINPGPDTATIGFELLPLALGNRVYENQEDGIFASGNVLVAGNTVHENGQIGIRLDGGADALRNVVRQHLIGISARGSTSDIIENRSFINAVTGIEASYHSNVLRNVTYNNGLHGIHADRFSGVIDHNLIYSTGYASLNVEGPGFGAQVTHNTIYEPCHDNEGVHTGPTTLTTGWDMHVFMEEMFSPDMPTFTAPLWGGVTIEFGEAVSDDGISFDLGPGGGSGAQLTEPLPPGQVWQIPYEIVALDLSSEMSGPIPGVGIVEARLAEGTLSTGLLTLENVDGFLMGTNQIELWFEFTFTEQPGFLMPIEPMAISYSISPDSGFGALDVLQIPLQIPSLPSSLAELVLVSPEEEALWRWQLLSAEESPIDPPPPPQDRGVTCAEIGIIIQTESSHVLLRQNAVYVEGSATAEAGDPNSINIFVADDSTFRWDSDFNAWITDYGSVGVFAGTLAHTLADWQAITGDDLRSLAPDVQDVWVDPDGDDNVLGGLVTGFDDNFHLRSPFGQVAQGALAPVEDVSPGGNGLPFFLPVIFETTFGTVDDLSPLVDAGDPAAPFLLEMLEHGKFANIGAYGNTPQASRSQPEYVHLVHPIGAEQLVPGRTYEIRWRSHDPAGVDDVAIELWRGIGAILEMVITPSTADVGSYTWTVPPFVTHASDYQIVVTRPSALSPGTDIVGASRFLFEIGGDTRPPTVLRAGPQPVEFGLPTNADIDSLRVHFSENVFGAADPTSYELRRLSDNMLFTLSVSYAPGPTDGDPSLAILDVDGGPLPEGDYRLTVFGSGISDPAGLALDGAEIGAPSDYVRFFTVDKTSPTVAMLPVLPDPGNSGVDSLYIVFDDPVLGLGLADVRLTRDGGPNLLDGSHRFETTDGMTWTLTDTTAVTSLEGVYTFELTAADSGIRDLAGNPLVVDASTTWEVDTTEPSVAIVAIAPDPRTTSVGKLTLVFSEEVFDFTLADLRLFRNGEELVLSGAHAPTTSDQITWTVGNLDALTSDAGSYVFKVVAGGTLRDAAGNPLAAEEREAWQVVTTPPLAKIIGGTPSPRVDAVETLIVSFNVPVSGFDLSDLRLTRNSQDISLAGLPAPTSLDAMNWHITGLSSVTAANGSYVFSLVAAGSGIEDLAGNPLFEDASAAWVKDNVNPTAAFTPVSPDPINTSVDFVTIVFSKPVTGVDLQNFVLSRGTTAIDWTEAQTLSSTDGVTWTLGNLSGLTSVDGSYTLLLDPGANLIEAFPGNPLLVGDSVGWLFDSTPPTVVIDAPAPHASFDAVGSIQIVFSEPVSGFDLSALVLTHRGIVVPLDTGPTLSSSDNQTWTLAGLASLVDQPGKYELSLRALDSGIEDAAGNKLRAGNFTTWRVLIPGDLTVDNRVGLKDLGRFGRNLGATGVTPEEGDLNHDLTVDRADLALLLGYYGSSLAPLPAEGSTTESTTLSSPFEPPPAAEPLTPPDEIAPPANVSAGFWRTTVPTSRTAQLDIESLRDLALSGQLGLTHTPANDAEFLREIALSGQSKPAHNAAQLQPAGRAANWATTPEQRDSLLLAYLSSFPWNKHRDDSEDQTALHPTPAEERTARDEMFAALGSDALRLQPATGPARPNEM